ncbi:MAG: putative YccA/Bax inhibitor family protein [Candidatus Aldehydirespiratoraceae bacterium]|jgi:uncharacterized YccA/Bax inhibitor family protein
MSNPIFNDQRMQRDASGWATPVHGDQAGAPPVGDGPVSDWNKKVMTVNGTISATLVLLILLLVSASFGWSQASGPAGPEGEETYQMPALAIVGIIVGFGAVILATFKPALAKFLGPVYSIGYGFAVGAISKMYESFQDGIVVQAIGATLSVFIVMLVLYRTRIIKVTDKFRRGVIFATIGIMVLYGVSFLMSFFGASISFINSPSLFGIGFSVVVCGIAAMNLALDFDRIERGVNAQMPKDYEWVSALGLLVTLVWLYLEMLRLLSKLRN